MNKNMIDMGRLAQKYPGFAFMGKGAELCGYNPQNSEYLVIDDGMCTNRTEEKRKWSTGTAARETG